MVELHFIIPQQSLWHICQSLWTCCMQATEIIAMLGYYCTYRIHLWYTYGQSHFYLQMAETHSSLNTKECLLTV